MIIPPEVLLGEADALLLLRSKDPPPAPCGAAAAIAIRPRVFIESILLGV